ncbi:hypothetical protein RCO27_15890 [Sphingosinicella sp. LHD-64]|uniref:tetratricopeptide repeat protein n=1 Tax=Sphingosinicella sp. LHD-64 TaxID=3072139 RepID=UPI00280C5BB1|nr:hypothetical protein [Sphingosinicella sp. LHD-64]MDQ8757710.1 hypothetical protein [Sphingosinicella sp. LHD-64]
MSYALLLVAFTLLPTSSILAHQPAAGEQPPAPEAISLLGAPLRSASPSAEALARYEAAKADYEADPSNPDKLVWYGRRTAYLGRFNEAIRIFGIGVERFPRDARFLRHRGHRYITTRQFDRAVEDLERANRLIEGTRDEIEPDGAPNARGIPISTLHSNIRYHLGLAYYLKRDWRNARRAYEQELAVAGNDDRRISASHWYYMTLRRMGADQEAAAFLQTVPAADTLDLLESGMYLLALRFAKGEVSEEEVLRHSLHSFEGVASGYGVANWHLYNGNRDRAFALMNEIVNGPGWANFAYIAAEADLAFHNARRTP